MAVKTRVELLTELIRRDDFTDVEIFDTLVPTFDIELYTLFNVISDSNVSSSCKFLHPPTISDDDELSIRITLSKKKAEKFIEFIDSRDGIFRYLKRHPLKLTASQNSTSLIILFQRLKK